MGRYAHVLNGEHAHSVRRLGGGGGRRDREIEGERRVKAEKGGGGRGAKRERGVLRVETETKIDR